MRLYISKSIFRYAVMTLVTTAIIVPQSAVANHRDHIARHQWVRAHTAGVYFYPVVPVAAALPANKPAPPAPPATTASAVKIFAYPAAGQTTAQQAQDRYECHHWAASEAGIATASAPASPTEPNGPVPAGPVRGALGGAALGAMGGAIAGDPGTGALIGAAVGGVVGLANEAKKRPPARAVGSSPGDYNRAMGVCLVARGYTVN